MAAASSLALWNSANAREAKLETIEMDPQYAQSLGLVENDVVSLVVTGRYLWLNPFAGRNWTPS